MHAGLQVALLAEGVDRNMNKTTRCMPVYSVALLAEGVDRNNGKKDQYRGTLVALLAEGVDRNWAEPVEYTTPKSRPPRGGRG